jgi:type IV pilus assembly protein PilB
MPDRTVLGRMLVRSGVVTEADVSAALAEQPRSGLRIGELLVRGGTAADAVARVLAAQLRLEYAEPPLRCDAAALALIDVELAERVRAVPLRLRDAVLVVAIADPLDLAALDALRFRSGRRIEPVVATAGAIAAAIGSVYQDRTIAALLARLPDRAAAGAGAEPDDVGALQRASEAAPVVGLVDHVFARAVEQGASDVHLEPDHRSLRVRVRVDGVLRELLRLPRAAAPGVVSRLKVLAALDIAERRRPQDGRASIRTAERAVAARISTLPSIDGEKVVIRLLDARDAIQPLEQLGLAPRPLAELRAMVARPHGLVLVTGPTGSGKTTTLYAVLATLDRERRNVVTLEDPVEYRLSGLTQVQIHAKAGLGFATALRAVLRQDPDVIMVGELRDRATARIALAAAMTGHLVLATLHTNDAPGAAARLLEMGAPPYLVAAALLGAVAQRLVRRCCERCAAPTRPADAGERCQRCGGEGLVGRIGLFEVLTVDERLRALLGRRASAAALRRAALENGMPTIESDAVAKLRAGLTTLDEVRPFLPPDAASR